MWRAGHRLLLAAPCAMARIEEQRRGYKVLFCGREFLDGFNFTAEELAGEPGVPFMTRFDADLLRQAPQLRYILQFGVGLEGVDIPAARSSGVRVANIPSTGTGNAAACAEMALLLTLSLLRNTKAMAKSLADRTLGSPTGTMLAGKSALLIGFGSIARETVTRLAALGVRVAAVKRSPWVENDPEARLLADRGGPDDMHRMLGMADVVVLTCTLNETTRHLADARFLQAMRRGAVLVNVARGGLMEYGAVREALESGHLGGLGTDVAWSEPWDPEDPVASHPRCVMTPHVAGVTDVSYRAMARIVADEARRHARGEGPSDRVAVFAP